MASTSVVRVKSRTYFGKRNHKRISWSRHIGIVNFRQSRITKRIKTRVHSGFGLTCIRSCISLFCVFCFIVLGLSILFAFTRLACFSIIRGFCFLILFTRVAFIRSIVAVRIRIRIALTFSIRVSGLACVLTLLFTLTGFRITFSAFSIIITLSRLTLFRRFRLLLLLLLIFFLLTSQVINFFGEFYNISPRNSSGDSLSKREFFRGERNILDPSNLVLEIDSVNERKIAYGLILNAEQITSKQIAVSARKRATKTGELCFNHALNASIFYYIQI